MNCSLCSQTGFYRIGVLLFCKKHRAEALRHQKRRAGVPQCQTPSVDVSKPEKNIVWGEGDSTSWMA